MYKNKLAWVVLFSLLTMTLFLVNCAGCQNDGDDDDDDNNDDTGDDDTGDDDTGDDDTGDDDDDTGDDPFPDVPRFNAIWDPPTQSVLPDSLTSCGVFQQTECVDDTTRVCDLYDGNEKGWLTDPDPMLEQMYWYDRYYDLYLNMEGQHSDRYSTVPIAPGTPEEVWSDPELFERYDGYGDASGWTGMALGSAAARYQVTGTEADYVRMRQKLADMMLLFEVTEIPGMIARSHYAMLVDDGIYPIGNPGKAVTDFTDTEDRYRLYPLSDAILQRLPSYYTDGVEVEEVHRDVEPYWQGGASRDMYVRSLPGTMQAYDLLGEGEEEDRLRNVVKTEITCTLNRMKKMRIINLQSNALIREFITAYLSGGRLDLEPDDIDLTAIDTIIGYVMEEPNSAYMDQFDPTCPDGPPMEITDPTFDLDASNTVDFLIKFMAIADRSGDEAERPIAWIQAPGVRGGDIVFMVQWALTAHYLTDDDRYLEFVDQMTKEIEFWPIINTMGSLFNPKWCKPTFAPSLIYPSLWNIQARIDPTKYPEFWNEMGTAIFEEMQDKELAGAGDAFFGILYDYMVNTDIDPDQEDFVDEMVQLLSGTEQYQAGAGNKFEPRRNYPVLLHSDPPPEFDLDVEWPTQEDLDMCLEEVELFGFVFYEGWIEDDLPRAVDYLPIKWRVPGSMQFAMGPWMLERSYGSKAGRVTWPMQGLTSAFWTGRAQGTITEGAGTALAWRDTGEACK